MPRGPAKSLSERIAERAATKKPPRYGQNRAAFLALRSEIEEALADGWPVKTVWETLREEGRVAFSYQAFRSYVVKLITSRKAPAGPMRGDEAGEAVAAARPPAPAAQPASASVKPGASGIAGFHLQATADKEKLL